jgi:hypothetical protein
MPSFARIGPTGVKILNVEQTNTYSNNYERAQRWAASEITSEPQVA